MGYNFTGTGVTRMNFNFGKRFAGTQERRRLSHVLKDLHTAKKDWKKIQADVVSHNLTKMRFDQNHFEENIKDFVGTSHQVVMFDFKFLDYTIELLDHVMAALYDEEKYNLGKSVAKAIKKAEKSIIKEYQEIEGDLRGGQQRILAIEEEGAGNIAVRLSVVQKVRTSFNFIAEYADRWRARRMGRDLAVLEKNVKGVEEVVAKLKSHQDGTKDESTYLERIIDSAHDLVVKAYQTLLIDLIATKTIVDMLRMETSKESTWVAQKLIPKSFKDTDDVHEKALLGFLKENDQFELRQLNVLFSKVRKAQARRA